MKNIVKSMTNSIATNNKMIPLFLLVTTLVMFLILHYLRFFSYITFLIAHFLKTR